MGTFFFCGWLGFTPTQVLNAERGSLFFHLDIKSKIVQYDKHTKALKHLSKEGLNSIGQPNHGVNLTAGMCPFYQKLQHAINQHCRNLCETE